MFALTGGRCGLGGKTQGGRGCFRFLAWFIFALFTPLTRQGMPRASVKMIRDELIECKLSQLLKISFCSLQSFPLLDGWSGGDRGVRRMEMLFWLAAGRAKRRNGDL